MIMKFGKAKRLVLRYHLTITGSLSAIFLRIEIAMSCQRNLLNMHVSLTKNQATNLKYTQQIYLMQESKNENIRECIFLSIFVQSFPNLCTHPKFPTSQTLDDPPNNQNNNNNNGLAYSSTSTNPSTTIRNRFAVCSSRIVFFFENKNNPTQKKIATDLSKIWTQQQQQQPCDNLVLPCTTSDWNLTHSNWLLLIFLLCFTKTKQQTFVFFTATRKNDKCDWFYSYYYYFLLFSIGLFVLVEIVSEFGLFLLFSKLL